MKKRKILGFILLSLVFPLLFCILGYLNPRGTMLGGLLFGLTADGFILLVIGGLWLLMED